MLVQVARTAALSRHSAQARPARPEHWEPRLARTFSRLCSVLRAWRRSLRRHWGPYPEDHPACSRCEHSRLYRSSAQARPARPEHWEPRLARTFSRFCSVLRAWRRSLQRHWGPYPEDYPACSSCEHSRADRHSVSPRPAHREHWELLLARTLFGSCPVLQAWLRSIRWAPEQILRS